MLLLMRSLSSLGSANSCSCKTILKCGKCLIKRFPGVMHLPKASQTFSVWLKSNGVSGHFTFVSAEYKIYDTSPVQISIELSSCNKKSLRISSV